MKISSLFPNGLIALFFVIHLCLPCFGYSQGVSHSDGRQVKVGSPLLTNAEGISFKAFSAIEDLSLSSDVALRSQSGKKLAFLQSAWVLEISPKSTDSAGAVLLVTSSNGETVEEALGWVSLDDVMITNQPLFAAPGIYKKCMIVNRIEEGTQKWDLVRLQRRPIEETSSNSKAKEVRLNNVFFVYKESRDKKFVLLGTTESFSEREGPNENVILGWAPVSRVAFWNTRFGFECDITSLKQNPPRQTPTYIFRSVDLAQTYGPGGDPTDSEFRTSYVFQEDVDFVSKRETPFFLPDEPRFVVMGKDEGSGTEVSLKEVLINGQRKLYHVGVVGSLDGKSRAFRDSIRKLRESLRKVQIVFLMDKTEEMEPYLASSEEKISPIERTVGQILEDYRLRLGVPGDNGRELEMSLSFYADEVYSSRPFVLQKLVKVNRSEDLDGQMKEFKQVSGDGGGDAPDSLFSGIEQALKLFSPLGNKRRILIVIGTMGDRIGDDATKLEQTIQRIEKVALGSKPMPIEIYSIQVPTTKVLEGHPDAVRFVKQMGALATRLNKSWQTSTSTKDEISDVSPVDPTQSGRSDIDRIRLLCEKLQNRVKGEDEESNEAIEALRAAAITGKIDTKSTSMVAGEFLRARLEAAKVSRDEVPPEIFDEGYVWKESFDHGGIIPQVRAVVNVERRQAENLLTIVRAITETGAFRVGKKLDLEKLSDEVIDTLAGDSIDAGGRAKNLTDYLRNRSLPFQSKIIESIVKGESAAITKEDEKHLLRVKEKLQDILAFRYRDYEWQSKKLASGEQINQWVPVPGTERPASRFYSNDGDPNGRIYIWLDFATEMP